MKNSDICFIGNSHLVCVKEAFTEDPLGRVNYFYAPGLALRDFEIVDGHISASSARAAQLLAARNGHTALPIAQQKMFVIVGLQLGLRTCALLWAKYRLWPHHAPKTELLSRDVMSAAIEGAIRDSVSFRIARRLREETSSPIVLVVQPSPIEAILSVAAEAIREESEYRRVRRARGVRAAAQWRSLQTDPAAGSEVNKLFVETLHRVAQDEGLGAIEQPSNTMKNVLTSTVYRREERPDDVVHTNKAYGHEILCRLKLLSDRDIIGS